MNYEPFHKVFSNFLNGVFGRVSSTQRCVRRSAKFLGTNRRRIDPASGAHARCFGVKKSRSSLKDPIREVMHFIEIPTNRIELRTVTQNFSHFRLIFS